MVNGQNFMDELNKFAGNIQGDPRQQVQNLLNNGQNNDFKKIPLDINNCLLL